MKIFMRSWALANIGTFAALLLLKGFKSSELAIDALSGVCFLSLISYCIISVFVYKGHKNGVDKV